MTIDPEAVVSVLPMLKINRAFALPPKSRIRCPVSCADDAKQ